MIHLSWELCENESNIVQFTPNQFPSRHSVSLYTQILLWKCSTYTYTYHSAISHTHTKKRRDYILMRRETAESEIKLRDCFSSLLQSFKVKSWECFALLSSIWRLLMNFRPTSRYVQERGELGTDVTVGTPSSYYWYPFPLETETVNVYTPAR